jgi:hypothetical protein
MSKRTPHPIAPCAPGGHAFPIGARPSQRHPEAARVTGLSVLWRRVPITTVTIALVFAVWIYDHVSTSSADSAPLRPNPAEYVPPLPLKPSPASHTLHKRTEGTAALDANVGLPGFKRIQVGKDETDYVAEDVTIRLFKPRVTAKREPRVEKQLDIGEDVTVRSFADKPTQVPPTRPGSAAVQSLERSLPISR